MSDVRESISIHAPATAVYDIVSDLPRMGSFSPENRGGRWLGKSDTVTVGRRFVGVNRARKWLVWPTQARVVRADRGECFSFEVYVGPSKVALWEYAIAPDADGNVTVTESWTDRRHPRIITVMDKLFGETRDQLNSRNMRQTLQRMKVEAERAS